MDAGIPAKKARMDQENGDDAVSRFILSNLPIVSFVAVSY